MSQTVRFGVSLDSGLLDQFDELIKRMGYENRSEAIRDLIRDKLAREQWQAPTEETFAVVVLTYSHPAMSVHKRLTEAQHRRYDRVVSVLHVHIDEENCLEVVVLRGPGQEIRAFGEGLISMRAVRYGKLHMGTGSRQVQ